MIKEESGIRWIDLNLPPINLWNLPNPNRYEGEFMKEQDFGYADKRPTAIETWDD